MCTNNDLPEPGAEHHETLGAIRMRGDYFRAGCWQYLPSLIPSTLRLLIPVALFIMLFPMMLDIKLGDMKETLKRPGLLGIALIMNFALSPLIMIVLLYVFKLTALPSLVVGLFLYG